MPKEVTNTTKFCKIACLVNNFHKYVLIFFSMFYLDISSSVIFVQKNFSEKHYII